MGIKVTETACNFLFYPLNFVVSLFLNLQFFPTFVNMAVLKS